MESQLLMFGEPATFRSVVLFSAALFVVLVGCFLLFSYVNSRLREERDRITFLEQYQALQRDYYEGILYSSHVARLLRHDLRNHLQTVRLLYDQNPARAASYLQEVKQALLHTAPDTNSGAPLLEHLLITRKQTAAAAGHPLTLKLDNSNMNDAQAVAFVSFIVNAVDIALESAEPGSEILASTLPGGERGIEVCYQGALLRQNRMKWQTLGTLFATAGGATSYTQQNGRTLLRAVLPDPKAVV